MNWIIENKEWVFSGIGVFILSLIISFIFKRRGKVNMTQKSGKGSVNIQAGEKVEIRDVKR